MAGCDYPVRAIRHTSIVKEYEYVLKKLFVSCKQLVRESTPESDARRVEEGVKRRSNYLV